jgi:hypothetical protein
LKASGATNRGRQRIADAERNAEASAESLRLGNLPADEAEVLRQVFDWIEWGVITEEALRERGG